MVRNEMTDDLDILPERFFGWWNDIIKREEDASVEEFSQYFSDNAEIITNEKLVCKGLEDITKHFMGVKTKTSSCAARLPMKNIFSKENKIFVHYLIDAAFESEKQVIAVMGYMLINSGKIETSCQLQYVQESKIS